MEGFAAEMMFYDFYSGIGSSCHLGIVRKEQFPNDEDALICMLLRYNFHENDSPAIPEEYVKLSTEEDFVEDVTRMILPVYGKSETKEVLSGDFINLYTDWINEVTAGAVIHEKDGTFQFRYNDYEIFRNRGEYSGNYQLFDPLRGQIIHHCFQVLDAEYRKEYIAITARYYLFLGTDFHSL